MIKEIKEKTSATRIFVITNKNKIIENNLPSIYKYLNVGSAERHLNGVFYDDTKDNISSLNPYFCELTGLYWIWKNCSEDIVGLVHYRRFFYNLVPSVMSFRILGENEVKKGLIGRDAIVPTPTYVSNIRKGYKNVLSHYGHYHNTKDLLLCGDIIRELFPPYFGEFQFVCNSRRASYYNMFITHKDLLNSYCSWLFPILFSLMNKIDYKNRSISEQRVFGYLSEILFNVWLRYNKVKTKYIEVCRIDQSCPKQWVRKTLKKIILR